MSEPCDCDPILEDINDLKSSNSSLNFKLCNRGVSMLLPITSISEQLALEGISTNGLSEGEYLINFDSSGEASYVRFDTSYDDYILRNYEILVGNELTEDRAGVLLPPDTYTFFINSLPPLGVVPTHVKLNVDFDMPDDNNIGLLLDENNNTIHYARSSNDGDEHHSTVYGVKAPITFDPIQEKYRLVVTNTRLRTMYIHVQGFVRLNNQFNTNTNTFVAGGDILDITYLNHNYDSSDDTAFTTVEWVTDPDLNIDQSYIVRVDLGGGNVSDFVVDVAPVDCDIQQLNIDWGVGNGSALLVDVVIIQGDRISESIASNNGGEQLVADNNVNCITTITI